MLTLDRPDCPTSQPAKRAKHDASCRTACSLLLCPCLTHKSSVRPYFQVIGCFGGGEPFDCVGVLPAEDGSASLLVRSWGSSDSGSCESDCANGVSVLISFLVSQRLSIRANLHFRSFSVSDDLCFVCHPFAMFSYGLNFEEFALARLGS